ncbi:MAG: hypothetical protein AMXMBFR64_58360 [Myxococcales bacterium]
MTGSQTRVLVVDDNVVDRELIRRLLGAGCVTVEAGTAQEALAALGNGRVDCSLLDYRLPDADGLQLLPQVVRRGVPVVMLTGQGDEMIAVEAMKRGADDYLVKGHLDAVSLQRAVRNAMERRAMALRIEQQQGLLADQVAELERRRQELEESNRRLAEREQKLAALLDQLPALVWTTDEALRCMSASGALPETGPEQLEAAIGADVSRLFQGVDGLAALMAAHQRALAGRPTQCAILAEGRTCDTHVKPSYDHEGRVVGVIGVAVDATETRRLEQQLRHAQKLDSLGKLAGGVAHDLNNILTAIVSFTELVRGRQAPGSRTTRDLDQVLRASARATALVRQLLAFSRRQPTAAVSINPDAVVAGIVPMLTRLLPSQVRLRVAHRQEAWYTRIDPAALEQVIVNLVVNARDALPDGGTIAIGSENLVLGEEIAIDRQAPLAPGHYVVVSVSDDGTGMTAAVRERLFEPFYTTKEVGQGTGLGLSMVYGIVRQAGGQISVHSEVGHGTTLRVHLPRCDEPAEASDAQAPGPVAGGSETLLVVEDDPQVRLLTVRALAEHGYRMLEASGVEEALAITLAHPTTIDLVVSDLVMPDTSGPEMVRRIRDLRPNVRVLYMSGYAFDGSRTSGLLDVAAPLLQKPFGPEALARKVRALLDEAA